MPQYSYLSILFTRIRPVTSPVFKCYRANFFRSKKYTGSPRKDFRYIVYVPAVGIPYDRIIAQNSVFSTIIDT